MDSDHVRTCSMCNQPAAVMVEWANDTTGKITWKDYCDGHYELLRLIWFDEHNEVLDDLDKVIKDSAPIYN